MRRAMAALLVFVGGLLLQWQWDRDCRRVDPGFRWDAERWECAP
jgi:hypothetical protein